MKKLYEVLKLYAQTSHIEHVMIQLWSKTQHCPQCSKQYPRHEPACAFVDIKVVDILAEVAISLNPPPDNSMTNVRQFIDERNTKTESWMLWFTRSLTLRCTRASA